MTLFIDGFSVRVDFNVAARGQGRRMFRPGVNLLRLLVALAAYLPPLVAARFTTAFFNALVVLFNRRASAPYGVSRRLCAILYILLYFWPQS